ncbi:MAG TPA: pyrimidine-nucleoside phosphorylase [Anaerolineales bacterium]|nr:pyrimidine-nucleoside phosphorylase [Anaerolineales bacterium]
MYRIVDLITKKRDGGSLTTAEIEWFIKAFTAGDVPDYQAAALAMAIYFRGMSPHEIADLTLAMAHSGEVLDLSDVAPVVVDKHSTGGVGDKTTLVVEPLVSACGLPVGKMSGRGLGYSGGTLYKMESIRGYRVGLTTDEFRKQLREIGLVLAGQSGDLAPADGKLYALRDVTGTVPSIPLIASSVMSKKIAAGAHAIVLDVKVGSGAFMATVKEATELARTMVKIGKSVGRKTVALISDMNQPLGFAVGNALEVREAVETLKNGGPADFREHCLHVAAQLLVLGKQFKTPAAARAAGEAALADGRAFAKFRALVAAQGGDVTQIDNPDLLPQASLIETVPSPKPGYLKEINARAIGIESVALGGGRAKKGDPIDPAVGIVVHHKVGDRVEKGEPLFTLHANDPAKLAEAREHVLAAHGFSREKVRRLPLFYRTVV